MKKQKINIVAYSEKDSDQWFSCDKKEFEQMISANNLFAKENEELERKLAEKDKEIEELKDLVDIWKTKLFEKMETQILSVTKEKEQQIRHQVCNEIRKFCRDNFTICLKDAPEQEQAEVLGYDKCLKELREFLDQIVGEKEC